jgi:hypothetical protein
MGFLKKIFKPVSKVLDKVIPNEIKPALPYLAAFAPMFGPTSALMGKGIMQRALISGGLNIGAQLAQEGNEGDINLLSAGLGALSGAMTTPGAAETFRGAQSANVLQDANVKRTALQKATDFGLEGLAKGSDMFAAGMADPFSTAGLKAAALPAATATGDLMQAEARQLEKQAAIDAALAEAEALADAGLRGDAIRNAMRAYGFFTDEEIESTVSSAGYRAGGRVGLRFGGIDKAIEMVEEETVEKGKEGIMQASGEDPLLIEEYNKYVFDLLEQRPDAKPMSFQDFKRMVKAGMKDGGRINFDEGGISLDEQQMEIIKGGGPKIVGLLAEADELMGTEGDRLEMALKMLLRDNKDNELLKYALDTAEERGETKLDVLMDLIKSQRIQDIMAFDKGKKSVVDKISVKDLARKEGSMKDGGLMDLGGKEMDLRKGGFVPIGKKERADDVPARLSKNEFVMTADAVRGAGGGDINKGAKRMYETMNNLEARA